MNARSAMVAVERRRPKSRCPTGAAIGCRRKSKPAKAPTDRTASCASTAGHNSMTQAAAAISVARGRSGQRLRDIPHTA